MSTIIRSAIVGLVLTSASVAGLSAASSAPVRDSQFSDNRDPFAGNNPNSPEGARAYWDYQSQHGN